MVVPTGIRQATASAAFLALVFALGGCISKSFEITASASSIVCEGEAQKLVLHIDSRENTELTVRVEHQDDGSGIANVLAAVSVPSYGSVDVDDVMPAKVETRRYFLRVGNFRTEAVDEVGNSCNKRIASS